MSAVRSAGAPGAGSASLVVKLPAPYLLFLGDVTEAGYAKTAFGLRDWARELCVGEFAMPEATVTTGLPAAHAARGAGEGRALDRDRRRQHRRRAEAELDPEPRRRAGSRTRRRLRHARPARRFARTQGGRGAPRSAARSTSASHRQAFPSAPVASAPASDCSTVGTDCALGKKYTALALEGAIRRRGLDVDFRATGQTGIMIAGSGMPIDAVVADFIAGAAEVLSPDAAPDHWDVIEGQGSLFHPAYAGVSLGLLHGSQPDVLVLCHEPGRTHLLGYPDFPTPSLPDAIALHLGMGSLTNPKIRCAGVSFNTAAMTPAEADAVMMRARRGNDRPAGRRPDARRPGLRPPRRGLPRLMARASWFQRFLLPGFAFKAVVIGGGYSTGREIAEFFVPVGPWGGIAAMAPPWRSGA